MVRTALGPIVAASLIAILAVTPARGAEKGGGNAAPAGEPAQNAAPTAPPPDAGSATQHGIDGGKTAKRNGKSAQREGEGPGPAIKKAAEETGHALDRGTKDFRDGAENFFKDVGRFFSGGK